MQLELEAKDIAAIAKQIVDYAGGLAVANMPPREAHWVSMREACRSASEGGLGWSETLIKNGIASGHLNPISLGGSGGTNIAVNELAAYQKWLLEKRVAHKLPQQFLKKNAETIPVERKPTRSAAAKIAA